MTNLSKKLGEMNFDGLFTDVVPAVQVRGGIIRKQTTSAVTLKRGTILAKSYGTAGDGKLVILGSTAANNETLSILRGTKPPPRGLFLCRKTGRPAGLPTPLMDAIYASGFAAARLYGARKKGPNRPFEKTMVGRSAYQMPKTVCMPRLTAAMATQQQKPVKIGFPPVLTSCTMLVFIPTAAMAMMIKNLLSSLKGANT